MQRLEVSGAVRPLWWPLGIKGLIHHDDNSCHGSQLCIYCKNVITGKLKIFSQFSLPPNWCNVQQKRNIHKQKFTFSHTKKKGFLFW